VERSKRNCGRISVFKGREAKLNFAVFQVLSLKGPQTIYDIRRELRTRRGLKQVAYPTVNRRVRALQKLGYVKKVGVKKTKTGSEKFLYDLTANAYLAMLLNSINLNNLITRLDEATALRILGEILSRQF